LAERSVLGAYVQQTRDDTRPWGLAGGRPGGKASMWLNPDEGGGKQLNSKVIGQVLKKGDVLRLVGAGGGGWGDATKRKKALTERDRAEGFTG
jgi:N-methylhydantoinase B